MTGASYTATSRLAHAFSAYNRLYIKRNDDAVVVADVVGVGIVGDVGVVAIVVLLLVSVLLVSSSDECGLVYTMRVKYLTVVLVDVPSGTYV